MKIAFKFITVILLFTACTDLENITPADQDSDAVAWKKGTPGDIDLAKAPSVVVTTTGAAFLTSQTATSGGNVVSNGGGPNSLTDKGICYNTSPNPTTANTIISAGPGAGIFTSFMYGLTGNTTYYVRAYAIKSGVTYYGNQITFTTLVQYGPVTDIDGNTYTTITIGSQVWMAENLKTTTYRDGTLIPNVPDSLAWYALGTGAYCNYGNNAANAATYGRLYNWYAATDAHNIAPAGYHVPSLAEWDVLRNYLGGLDIAGGKAKEKGLVHWHTPNSGANNSGGFTALPGGRRFVTLCSGCTPAYFGAIGDEANWWTSSSSGANASFVMAEYNSEHMYRSGFAGGIGYYDKRTGYSLRCVKD